MRSCPSLLGSEGDQVAQGIIQGSWKNFFGGCSALCIHSRKKRSTKRKRQNEKLAPPYRRCFLGLERERGVSRKAHIPHQLPVRLLWQVVLPWALSAQSLPWHSHDLAAALLRPGKEGVLISVMLQPGVNSHSQGIPSG